MSDRRYPCHCCGFWTLSDPQSGSYEVCPVCFWEDDAVQNEDPAFEGGANRVCLAKARLNFIRIGACAEESIANVRPVVAEFPAVPVILGLDEKRAVELRRGLKIQILALVRSMPGGAVGIAAGSTQISSLRLQLDQPDLEDALRFFAGVASDVDDLPIGSERDSWDPTALAVKDRQLVDYESRVRDRILAECGALEQLLVADLAGSKS
jgi:Cysteine-rich CPCC